MTKPRNIGEEIRSLHKAGLSYRQIKDILNCSLSTISYHMGAGQKEKSLNRQRDRRSAIVQYIQALKQDSVCADCGENYPYWMMDFDHLEDKKFNMSKSINHNMEEIQAEIAKCDIVCANCHRNRTHLRMVKHGSDTMDLSEIYGE